MYLFLHFFHIISPFTSFIPSWSIIVDEVSNIWTTSTVCELKFGTSPFRVYKGTKLWYLFTRRDQMVLFLWHTLVAGRSCYRCTFWTDIKRFVTTKLKGFIPINRTVAKCKTFCVKEVIKLHYDRYNGSLYNVLLTLLPNHTKIIGVGGILEKGLFEKFPERVTPQVIIRVSLQGFYIQETRTKFNILDPFPNWTKILCFITHNVNIII